MQMALATLVAGGAGGLTKRVMRVYMRFGVVWRVLLWVALTVQNRSQSELRATGYES